jgi:peroxiredoxin/YHS domain-containing protein
MTRSIVLLSIVLTVVVASAVSADTPEKALCAVCAVKGETSPEKVRAHAEHEGTTYYFCADHCREAFQADPVAYVPPTLPRPAPAFVVETLDGSDVALADLTGKVVLLDFWATWCKPCVKIMPEVQLLYDRYREHGFTVAGVSIDEGDDRIRKINKFLDRYDVSYPVYSDAKASPAWNEYRVKAVPAMFLIDRSGDIVAQWLGVVDHDAVAAEVAKVLAPRTD